MNDNFQQWLIDQDIDAQTLEPVLERSLRSRFEAERPAAAEPVAEVLMVVGDCQWPIRAIWQPVH